MIGRTFCERFSKVLGQNVLVDNQSGGGGVIASQTAARAAPDGYTLMQGYVATHGTSPATRKLPYDPIKDFTPIGMIGSTPNVLVVNASLPVTDVKSFIEYLRKNMGKVSYGSAGAGSLTHLTAELFKSQTNTFMVHIPYRGIAPATTDLIAGQTQAMFPGLAAALPHIRNGRLRAIAVTGNQRHPALKDVPTMEESGLKGFDAQQWYGVVGPAGMPAAVVTQLNNAMAQVLAMPDLREKLSAEAVEMMPMTPAQFGEYMKRDLARWTNLARERNINLDNA
jgi:tripartite-type tricarboxylate transporter receptor subunit TctC